MDGHVYGKFTMMALGPFKFGIDTAAYQELSRTTEFKWAEQPVFGELDNLQYLGPGADVITLNGVIFPEFKGGFEQLDGLRALGGVGQPHMLVSGTGKVMGQWVINSVEEGQGVFAAMGVPRRQEFTLSIKKFDW